MTEFATFNRSPTKSQRRGRAVIRTTMLLVVLGVVSHVAGCTKTTNNRLVDRQPTLVVMVVVDQLRASEFSRLRRENPEGGLAFFGNGVVYERAFYQHAVTQTAPGHATLVSGASPAVHGIVANKWYDRSPLVTGSSESLFGTLVSIKAAEASLVSTIGDSLVAASNGRSRVVAVSGKERAAILLSGRLGEAFWYEDGYFVSKARADERQAEWLRRVNNSIQSNVPPVWYLARDESAYERQDDLPYEIPPENFDNRFPHELAGVEGVAHSPFLDSLVLQIAKEAILNRRLGQGPHADLLMISLSSTDRVGHFFGPNSREMEDNLYRLDHELRRFAEWLNNNIGLRNVVVILTADHGVDLVPEEMIALGLPAARLDMEGALAACNDKVPLDEPGKQKIDSEFFAPYAYVRIEPQGALTRSDLLDRYSACLENVNGIRAAFPAERPKPLGDSYLDGLIANSTHPSRSGDIYVIQEGSTYMHHNFRAATHGSPYSYDRHVPLAIFREGMCAQQVWDIAHPESIAATIAAALSIPAPPYADAKVLSEALANIDGKCEEVTDIE